MSHTRNKLTVRGMRSLPVGAHGDGAGLWYRKTSAHSGQWVFRYRLHDKARQMGLGSALKVSLAEARALRDQYQTMVRNGLDPKVERMIAKKARATDALTLNTAAEIAFEARKAELKGDGKAGRWLSPLSLHILPKIGDLPIEKINQNIVRSALQPIWHEKPETARKAANRLNIVLKHSVALGVGADIQAVAKAKMLLGKQNHVPEPIPSMPWKDVPAFYASLDGDSLVKLALKLLILNPGSRSKPFRELDRGQIEGAIWTVPGASMKGRRGKTSDWRTPLSPESLKILKALEPFEKDGKVFPSKNGTGFMSDMTMSGYMKRVGLKSRPHGFRTSFKTWGLDTGQDRDLTELCMAHKIYGRVEASYIRTDQLEARAEICQQWSDFVTSHY